MIANEIKEKVKKENPGKKIFYGKISYQLYTGVYKEEEFLFREPLLVDAEMMQSVAAKNPLEAQNNLLHSLILFPVAGDIIGRLRPYPNAVTRFVDERINPFYGGNPKTEIQEL